MNTLSLSKIEKVESLIRESFVSNEVKKLLLDSVYAFTPQVTDQLIESFEREQHALRTLEEMFHNHDIAQRDELRQFELDTRPMVQKHIDAFVESVMRDIDQKVAS